MPENLCASSIRELHDGIRSGAITRRAIVDEHLARIVAVNPLTNTFVEVRGDEALAEADAADTAHGQELVGALDGIPMSIKDSYGVAGLHRTDGLPLNAARLSSRDDTVVARLREAGALILGHGNVPDLCVRWNTVSGLFGTSRNPRDSTRTVGGSSGGEAANVAAGMATASLGQDLGGSIRVPAAFCGVYGIRTSPGIVANSGEFPAFPPTATNREMGTIGPLARSVADLEAVYSVIAAFDPRDPISVPVTTGLRDRAQSCPPRVALLSDQTGAAIEPEIEQRLHDTAAHLRNAGYEIVEDVFPDFHRAPELWAEITGTDLMRAALPRFGADMIESGRQHVEQLFGSFELGDDIAAYADAWVERSAMQEAWARFAETYPLILAPIAGMPTPPLDFDHMLDHEQTMALFDAMRCVPWVNLLGLPALALPNGIQIVGRRFGEADVFAAARAIERALPRVEIAPL